MTRYSWGELVCGRLRRLGRKQRELAEAVGVTPQHMCSVLKGKEQPSYTLKLNIEQVLKVWDERDREWRKYHR